METVKVERINDCSICLEPYAFANDTHVIPVLLLCGHTFHRKCLAKIPSHHGNTTEIKCPLCRALTPGPVQSLKPNYALLNLILSLLKEEEKTQKVMCDECSKEGLLFCFACNLHFCGDCDKALHLPKVFQSHQRVPISQKPDPSTSICSEHKKELEIFCINCQSLICLYCRDYGPHKTHETNLKQNIVPGAISELKNKVQKFQEEVTKLNKLSSSLSVTVDQLNQNSLEISTEIDQCTSRIIKLVQLRAQQLKEQTQKCKIEREAPLTCHQEELSHVIAHLNLISNEICYFLQKDTSTLLMAKKQLDKKIEEAEKNLQKLDIKPINFQPIASSFDLTSLQASITSFGVVGDLLPPTIIRCSGQPNSIAMEWKVSDQAQHGYEVTENCVEIAEISQDGQVLQFKEIFRKNGTKHTITNLKPSTNYAVRVCSVAGVGVSSVWTEKRAKVPAGPSREEFSQPGTFQWRVPEGVTAINAIVIGGGAAGGCHINCSGGCGGDSKIVGIVEAKGGTSQGNEGGLGGHGNVCTGGRAGTGSGGDPYSHGGGGAAGGEAGQDAPKSIRDGGGKGGSATLKYAGAGGNGKYSHQYNHTLASSGPGGSPPSLDSSSSHLGGNGGLYGGGGGGCFSGGGGGGGYSKVVNHPVVPGQSLTVVVGTGGQPVTGVFGYTGGKGGGGLVIISWCEEP